MIKNRIKEYRAKYDMKREDLAKRVGRQCTIFQKHPVKVIMRHKVLSI